MLDTPVSLAALSKNVHDRPPRDRPRRLRHRPPRGGAPERRHRTDRVREFREPGRAPGAGQPAHQQVRRGACRASATTAAARSWTRSRRWPSTAPTSCSAPTGSTSSRTRARRPTSPSTSRLCTPGDRLLGLDLAHGGHLTHGSPVNFSGKLYDAHFYGVEQDGAERGADRHGQAARDGAGRAADDALGRRERLQPRLRLRRHARDRRRGRRRCCGWTWRTRPA